MRNFFSIASNQVGQFMPDANNESVLVLCSELVIVSVEPKYDLTINEQNEPIQVKTISSETYRLVCTPNDIECMIERLKMELDALKQMEERVER